MATLIGVAEDELSTDFAIRGASQENGGAEARGFVGSVPGSVSVLCGTRYAKVRVRAERWDGRPPHQRAGKMSTSGRSRKCPVQVH